MSSIQDYYNNPIQEEVTSPTSITNSNQTITIQNIRIDFPVKPYVAQIQMMTKIIIALNNKENALLESPTGSGKSLALLCSALAWREAEINRIANKYKRTNASDNESPNNTMLSKIEQEYHQQLEHLIAMKSTQLPAELVHQQEQLIQCMQQQILQFKSLINETTLMQTDETLQKESETIMGITSSPIVDSSSKSVTTTVSNDTQRPTLKRFIGKVEQSKDTSSHIPRIFVGSRTHKQISQLVAELKHKTSYRPRTVVLGSRDQYCIHSKVKKSQNKAEDCAELLENDNCYHAKRTKKLLKEKGMSASLRVWDIEDLVSAGRQTGGCPYYASRTLYGTAEVIFCPYNYIIDPIIRKLLDINLDNDIVILDEEDASRSAGSIEISESTLAALLHELNLIIKYGKLPDAHRTLETMVTNIYNAVTSDHIQYDNHENERDACHFNSQKLLQTLEEMDIDRHNFKNYFLPAFEIASEHAETVRSEMEKNSIETADVDDSEVSNSQSTIVYIKCLSNGSLTIFRGLFMVLGLLFDEKYQYSNDYELVFIKSIDKQAELQRKRKRSQDQEKIWSRKIAFWCLNPSIIFRNMCDATRSIILTSGTLSPLNTFASELGTNFSEKLEANHVISESQVWVRSIPYGPTGMSLKGVYKNISTPEFQDEIGEALYRIVSTVPYGILFFLPSYSSLDAMLKRWRKTNLMDKIEEKKMVLIEPRGSDKIKFEKNLKRFYNKIKTVQEGDNDDSQDGAILFAVFRGKISEGIDFSNNYCRAVITTSIPFPGSYDLEVIVKKMYNTRLQRAGKSLLSGTQWYNAQGYRAINQALGRCIRHKNDWGAIIMLEERFKEQKNVEQLSKWVKNFLKVEPNFDIAMENLQEFVNKQLEDSGDASGKHDTDDIVHDTDIFFPVKIEPDISQDSIIKLEEEFDSTLTTVMADCPNYMPYTSPYFSKCKEQTKNIIEQDQDYNEGEKLETLQYLCQSALERYAAVAILPSESSIQKNTLLKEALQQEALLQEILHQEALHQEALHQEALHQEALHQEVLHQEVLHQEVLQQMAIQQEPSQDLSMQDLSMKDSSMQDLSIQEDSKPCEYLPKEFPNLPKCDGVILCNYCYSELIYGVSTYSTMRVINDLTCISEQQIQELLYPAVWMSSSMLTGAIDAVSLPKTSKVLYDKEDGICYNQLFCRCNEMDPIGIMVCAIISNLNSHHSGRVYLYNTKVEFVVRQVSSSTEKLIDEFRKGLIDTFAPL